MCYVLQLQVRSEDVPLDELRALSICAEGAMCSANDWYEMFVESIKTAHISTTWRKGPQRAQVALIR